MGLDTTHGCWRGPYSAFARWRMAVCRAAGIEIVMLPPTDYRAAEPGPVWWTREWPELRYEGSWPPREPSDPLMVLIVHSDCEGVIRHRHTLPLAERLEALLPALDDDGPYPELAHRGKTVAFIAGLRLAHERGEDVEFQ